MNIHENRVKIVATAGPATADKKVLRKLIRSGLDIVRINFSHGKYEDYKKTIDTVRELENEFKRPIGILADMPGPKLRLRNLKTPLQVKSGSILKIVKDFPKAANEVNIAYPSILNVLKPGDRISIADGKVQVKVIKAGKNFAECKILNNGEIKEGAGLNFPKVDLPVPAITSEDFRHIAFACKCGVDFIGLSFIKDTSDLKKVRAFLAKIKAKPFLISKIERKAALINLKEIVKDTDGVMVARGDLGVEVPLEKVANIQKDIIKLCNKYGKPVITATQMLESMIVSPVPTRAEVSDVTNAIYDGTDAIMLSGETAVGKYPIEAVEMMFKIAKGAEARLHYTSEYFSYLKDDDLSDIISKNVVRIAQVYGVKDIIIPTESGKTARMVSRYRPSARIIALATSERVRRQLVLPFGIYPCSIPKHGNSSVVFKLADDFIKNSGMFKKGDKIIIAAGTLEKKGSASDFIKITTV